MNSGFAKTVRRFLVSVVFISACLPLFARTSILPSKDDALRVAYLDVAYAIRDGVANDSDTSARFKNGGPVFSTEGARFTMQLQGFGKSQPPAFQGRRAEYRHRNVTEWYVNGPWGIEQGFTIIRPPTRNSHEALSLRIRIGDGATLALENRGAVVRIGGRSIRYGGLTAIDSVNRLLPSHLTVRANEIRIDVNDPNASYPVTVDPWIQQGVLEPPSTPYGYFGTAVAMSGNTAVVGSLQGGSLGNNAAAYVFTLNKGIWTNTVALTALDGAPGDQFGSRSPLAGTRLSSAHSNITSSASGQIPHTFSPTQTITGELHKNWSRAMRV